MWFFNFCLYSLSWFKNNYYFGTMLCHTFFFLHHILWIPVTGATILNLRFKHSKIDRSSIPIQYVLLKCRVKVAMVDILRRAQGDWGTYQYRWTSFVLGYDWNIGGILRVVLVFGWFPASRSRHAFIILSRANTCLEPYLSRLLPNVNILTSSSSWP